MLYDAKCFDAPIGPINVNLSDEHLDASGQKVDPALSLRLAHIDGFNGGLRGALPDCTMDAIRDVLEQEIVFSPQLFFDPKRKPNKEVVSEFIKRIPLALNMLETLSSHGLMGFIERLPAERRDYYRSELNKVIAVFAACTYGCDELEEMPAEVAKHIVSYFRSENGLRWRKDIWGKNEVGIQCLRNVILALASFYHDDELLSQAINHRITVGEGKKTWKNHETSEDLLTKDLVRAFYDGLPTSRKKPNQTRQDIMHMISWLSPLSKGKGICDMMLSKRHPQTFPQFLKSGNGRLTPSLLACVRRVHDFSELLHEMYAESPGDRQYWPLVTKEDVNWAADQCKSTAFKPATARSRPMPEKYFYLLKEILDEGEAGWPGQCGHFDVDVRDSNGELIRIYCPVMPTIYSVMVRLPLRRGQVRRLDSGEGDVRRFNAETMRWEDNTGRNAGYWCKHSADAPDGGYAYEFEEAGDCQITGLFINTNKTAAPYHIPWQDPEIHRILWDLRLWQERHNPVKNPVAPKDYTDAALNSPQTLLNKLPTIFALFRLPPAPPKFKTGCPPTQSECDKAWQLLMAEVERRYNDAHPDTKITIVGRQKKTGQPQSAFYKSHGLRVRGLSNLHKSGIPIDLLSKMIAGHASILMTLYYIKYEPQIIHEMLTKAAFETQSREAREFIQSFQSWSIDEARSRSVAAYPEAITGAWEKEDQAQFCNVDIGMCPNDGTRCNEGGPILRKSKGKSGDKSVYGPVPGGRRNCVMCRFFVSGPPWLVPLELYQNSLLEKISRLYRREHEIQKEVSEMSAGVAADIQARAAMRQRRDALQAELIQTQNGRVEYENSLFNTQLLLKMSLAADNASIDKTSSFALVANDRDTVMRYHQVSEYEQAAYQVQASRWYGIVRNDELEAIRNRYHDQISFAAGDIPISFRIELTDEQRRAAHDRQAEFLSCRLKREQLHSLVNGTATLEDLQIHSELALYVDSNIAAGQIAPILPGRSIAVGGQSI
ncbi:VPA1269 family protein [Sinorhizobium meliloti]|uniref:VPA1269 family protein n=1 Tax=Rhizobium meliloti TaxID=382 RepID=UPI000FD71814|nr:VPA1269 family protein [Sinorhizobium meliloti]RVN37946.1 hypothetical protein CN118_14325 [Sinorhizobium meliloti]